MSDWERSEPMDSMDTASPYPNPNPGPVLGPQQEGPVPDLKQEDQVDYRVPVTTTYTQTVDFETMRDFEEIRSPRRRSTPRRSRSGSPRRPATPIEPTFTGFLATTYDALVLHELVVQGRLHHVARRPHDRERPELITSGSIFMYEEVASGIKRWTDGVTWSPSRILHNFLIYRELDHAFPPGEKKRAYKKGHPKRPRVKRGVSKESSSGSSSSSTGCKTPTPSTSASDDSQRPYIGSLVDSYPFKAGGLVKKTISIPYKGVYHHIVSYYTVEDAMNNKFIRPSHHPEFANIFLRPEIVNSACFRFPLETVTWSAAPNNTGMMQAYLAPQNGNSYEGGTRSAGLLHLPINGLDQPMANFAQHPYYHQEMANMVPGMLTPPQSDPNCWMPRNQEAVRFMQPRPQFGLTPIQLQHPQSPEQHQQLQRSQPQEQHQHLHQTQMVAQNQMNCGIPAQYEVTQNAAMFFSAPSPDNTNISDPTSFSNNYHLDTGRSRFASTAGFTQSAPRHMTVQEPRRHSNFVANQTTDMTPFPYSYHDGDSYMAASQPRTTPLAIQPASDFSPSILQSSTVDSTTNLAGDRSWMHGATSDFPMAHGSYEFGNGFNNNAQV